MGSETKIEWADKTFNCWIGCQKVSPGCDHCYAETQNSFRKWNGGTWGPHAPRKRTSPGYWKQPLLWALQARETGVRPRVFCASLADVFDNQAPDGARDDLWALIRATPELDWLLLTKRPENIAKMLPADWGDGYPNVWLGTTVEDQANANRRVPLLLSIPAKVRFLSCEPLLGHVALHALNLHTDSPSDALRGVRCVRDDSPDGYHNEPGPKIDWVIVGGESGSGARAINAEWAQSIRDWCVATGTPFLFKQWGEWAPAPETIDASGVSFHKFDDGAWSQRVGKKRAGRLLDGVEHNGFPEVRS